MIRATSSNGVQVLLGIDLESGAKLPHQQTGLFHIVFHLRVVPFWHTGIKQHNQIIWQVICSLVCVGHELAVHWGVEGDWEEPKSTGIWWQTRTRAGKAEEEDQFKTMLFNPRFGCQHYTEWWWTFWQVDALLPSPSHSPSYQGSHPGKAVELNQF